LSGGIDRVNLWNTGGRQPETQRERSHILKNRFAVVLFDLGSTLIYFDADWTKIFPESTDRLLDSLRNAGLELEESVFLASFQEQIRAYYVERETEFIEYTTAYILRRVLSDFGYPDPADALLRSALTEMYAVTQQYWKVEADAHQTLEQLKREGYRLGLVSNAGDDADVQRLIDNAGLRPYFDVILTSAAQGIRKPNPRIFWTALEDLNANPSQAAMVGDTLGADILGAKNAGVYSLWITRRASTPANLSHQDTIQPDAVIATLEELPLLLSA
jgi:HAD superfamily hydrolase (TIGR01662 family)